LGEGTSEVVIYARGTAYDKVYPNMQLLINGAAVASWSNVNGDNTPGYTKKYTYTSPKKITSWSQIKVTFTNDKAGRDLYIDKVSLDGATRETEAATTYTSVAKGSRCRSGYRRNPWMYCNGTIQY
jgi:endo-1,4-beta-xylanase